MAATGGGGGGRREGSPKIVADQISQSVQSTSNLLHLMLQSSPSRAQLMKLPRNLLSMTSTIKNTESVLEQMPQVVSSLDTHVERGLQCLPHLDTVVQLLSHMQSSQLKPLSRADLVQQQDLKLSEHDSRVT
ncbi:tobamovirus multiplication protein 2B-like isoform X1 [Salvia splendens]|uniref:tobamovirus multiplication protein 2B-like isoform X1 n=1 Tax=Salvia splendens TaxID=180675 RepID=UPI001C26B01E|nr:tobamovirus multiplication protein 2B-like isoform X1 [Salvia splendens]